jgi:hypothetical protein
MIESILIPGNRSFGKSLCGQYHLVILNDAADGRNAGGYSEDIDAGFT